MSNGSEVAADALMDALLVGETFTVPTVNLNDPAFKFPDIAGDPQYAQIAELTNEDLTTRVVGGTGTYDAIMASQAAHLKSEFTAGRITGSEYTKAYVALAQAACGQAIQFLLGKDQAYWASVIAQGQALTARVQLETAKAQLAITLIEVNNQRATFALNKIRLANEDAQYGITKYNLATTLPAQTAQTLAQTANVTAEGLNIPKQGTVLTAEATLKTKQASVVDKEILIKEQQVLVAKAEVGIAEAKLVNIPKEGLHLTAQTAQVTQQTANLSAEAFNIPKQGLLIDAQKDNVTKQAAIATEEILVKKQQVLVSVEEVAIARAKLVNIPKEGAQLDAKTGQIVKETDLVNYNLSNMMPAQLLLVKEQVEVQHAQTFDTHTATAGGGAIAGSVKSQKDLYAQQIISYQRSSQVNAAKVWTDAWVADSAIQDSPTLPTAFNAANISSVLTAIKNANGL